MAFIKSIFVLLGLVTAFFSFTVRASGECAKEGEAAGGSTLEAKRCCPGLVGTNSWLFINAKNDCKLPAPPGTGGSCVKCGDGKCDEKNFESKCLCPKDCM
jgi:hypothetical protein